MARDADLNFADLLALRCPARAEELTAVLMESRRTEIRGLLSANSQIGADELKARIAGRMASAGAVPEEFKSLPPAFRRRR